MFHKEGYTIIIVTLLVVAIGFVSTQTWVSPVWLQYVCYAALVIFLIYVVNKNMNKKTVAEPLIRKN